MLLLCCASFKSSDSLVGAGQDPRSREQTAAGTLRSGVRKSAADHFADHEGLRSSRLQTRDCADHMA